jgi:hypothetical protein
MTTPHEEPAIVGAQKVAFATLYRLLKGAKTSGRAMEEPGSVANTQMMHEIPEALEALMRAIHGESERWQYACLCDACCLRYAEHFVKEAGQELSTWCCTPCYQHLVVVDRPKKEESDG